jgi:hypothetical protein
MESKLFVDRGPGTARDLVAGEENEDSVVFRFMGENAVGRNGHFERVVVKEIDADALVKMRGQGNCAYLAAATKTKRSLAMCERDEVGVPKSHQKKKEEDVEGAQLRECVADLLEKEGNWKFISDSSSSLLN